ncbi:MAG: Rne/Rng family ribonuclease [Rhodovibrionaceae bacterium]|nr:Rne/Rng family ribonuclease [Rhodovibrionaceae bacterium]
MVKRMLIDASHPEETRVVVLSGNRVEEFDYEATAKRQLKGNIYLAKVTRVEPSLQAAFVDYGGNRHGFLPFSEIHPDYYRIPIADREALIAQEARLKAEAMEDEEENGEDNANDAADERPDADQEAAPAGEDGDNGDGPGENADDEPAGNGEKQIVETSTRVETLGGDEADDAARNRAQLLRHYKIQEVIKRRQVMLVQVSKEERGNKGAALTTYLSLAGRYCVLMPNTARGGGISRKIANPSDRRRLKKIVSELEIPEGMAVIVRTAGSQRSKAEIRRDYEYLLRLWNDIREATLQSTAPALIHEEGNLIKRSIRDLYTRDMDDILVEGEEGYKAAKTFMKSLMPSHARKVQLYKDETIPLLHRYQVENQLDAIQETTVGLKSGGYVVLNQTEALVAIDVNSGKATRERHIEETALKTNMEAAEEVARQLRLRDLAGLIVIDFIDMEENRHNRQVENKLKEAMKSDRARIQLGRISPFGLLEMSRQRLRPSLFESSTRVCPRCAGSGHIRATDTSALHVLRALEDEGIKRGPGEIHIALPSTVGLFLLNQMRRRLAEIEARYNFRVEVTVDDSLVEPDYRLERRSSTAPEALETPADAGADAVTTEMTTDAGEPGKRRRSPRRRKKSEAAEQAGDSPADVAAASEANAQDGDEAAQERQASDGDDEGERKPKKRRRRGKRGGRRRSRRSEDGAPRPEQAAGGEQSEGKDRMAESGDAETGPSDDQDAGGAPAEAENAGASAESAASAEADGKSAGDGKKRPRRRRRKSEDIEEGSAAAATDESTEAADAKPADSVAEAAQESGPEQEKPAKPARKRPSRARKKPQKAEEESKGEQPEASPQDDGASEPAPSPQAKGASKRKSPRAKSSESESASEAPTAEERESSREEEPADAGERSDDRGEEQRRKRGWWNRVISS